MIETANWQDKGLPQKRPAAVGAAADGDRWKLRSTAADT
jgi:hypothetical protein